MSHHVYTTPGFVLDSRPNGEAGKLVFIFARELGLVMTVAQGVRLDKSKLRYHIQDFSYALFSLVRGKEMWRLTGAGELTLVAEPHPLYVRIIALLRRLLHGEEKNEALFDTIVDFYVYIHGVHGGVGEGVQDVHLEEVECIIVLNILHKLGYVGSVPELAPFLNDIEWTDELIKQMKPVRLVAVREINSGLKASQL